MTGQARSLDGKVALVTGGGRGIGRAIALALAEEGADVGVTARTRSEIDAVAGEIRAKSRRGEGFQADLTDRAQVDALTTEFSAAFGRLDILFNNAGGGIENNTVLESDPELWIQDIERNLLSAYLVSRALIPLMVKSGGGKVINVGSGMGHRPGKGAYTVAKAGMWMFTQSLSLEVWEDGVDVNELIQGPVETELTRGHMKAGGPPPFSPSERVKTPGEVVPLALWLATQPVGGPTGQSFSLTRRPL
jgi:3-oxoacyl-[acyl-carrier protein] reductase